MSESRIPFELYHPSVVAAIRTYAKDNDMSVEDVVRKIDAFKLIIDVSDNHDPVEADMLNGNPITGAHHRALEHEILVHRKKRGKNNDTL